ncbi:MAG: hypothetical protein QOC78_1631 [Solirubrobacteraceae bacterium]|jgi:hypothetical protein|nr:hypothetical protein [Solirubrobacteraceae bacterium]
MERGPLACTDAERRAALALAARLRERGRAPRLEARWVRPGWPAWQALCAAAGVIASVLSVRHALTGLIVAAAALVLSAVHGRGRLPLGRARATQDVVARARAPARVAVVVLAAVDRPRAALLRQVPAPMAWLLGALLATVAFAVARLAGAGGTLLGAAQLVPAAVLLLATGALLEAAAARPEPADAAATDAAATDAAAAVAAAAPEVEVALVGAGELGLRARLRADRRAAEAVVLVWLEPAAAPAWRSAHPTLAALVEAALPDAERRGGRALPAGARPALALAGPPGDLTEMALAVVARLRAHLDGAQSPAPASSTK